MLGQFAHGMLPHHHHHHADAAPYANHELSAHLAMALETITDCPEHLQQVHEDSIIPKFRRPASDVQDFVAILPEPLHVPAVFETPSARLISQPGATLINGPPSESLSRGPLY